MSSRINYTNHIDKINSDLECHLKDYEDYVEKQNKENEKIRDLIRKKDEEFCREISGIHHAVNVYTVVRSNTDYMDIKSVICMGDIKVLSEKKFSKFARWLYKKLFGWTIEDYEWAKSYQRRIFPC